MVQCVITQYQPECLAQIQKWKSLASPSKLKPFKAAGPDRLKPLLLKELRDEIAPISQIIFERSIQTGKLPADCCRAQVTPIFKKGNKSSAANYRPISLTIINTPSFHWLLSSGIPPEQVTCSPDLESFKVAVS